MATVASFDDEARVVMARVARTFDLATRLLPADVRTDVRRLYLVLRTLDDLVDHGSPDARERIAAVESWARDEGTSGREAARGEGGARGEVARGEGASGREAERGEAARDEGTSGREAARGEGGARGEAARGEGASGREAELLGDLAARHPALPREAVMDFCAGMRADLAGPHHATDADLDRYCYEVAGTVGRLMAPLLGVEPGCAAEADQAARALGAAMQRTNILRDLREDARSGRVYLPDDALAAAGLESGCDPTTAAAIQDLPAWPEERRRALIAPQVARAHADYATGIAGIGCLSRGRGGIRAAAAMYAEILREIERDGYGRSGRRAVVPRHRKLRLVLGAALGGRP